MRAQRTIPRMGKPLDKMHVTEWLHQESNRFVKLHFGPDLAIYTVNRKGEVQRRVGLTSCTAAQVQYQLLTVRIYVDILFFAGQIFSGLHLLTDGACEVKRDT